MQILKIAAQLPLSINNRQNKQSSRSVNIFSGPEKINKDTVSFQGNSGKPILAAGGYVDGMSNYTIVGDVFHEDNLHFGDNVTITGSADSFRTGSIRAGNNFKAKEVGLSGRGTIVNMQDCLSITLGGNAHIEKGVYYPRNFFAGNNFKTEEIIAPTGLVRLGDDACVTGRIIGSVINADSNAKVGNEIIATGNIDIADNLVTKVLESKTGHVRLGKNVDVEKYIRTGGNAISIDSIKHIGGLEFLDAAGNVPQKILTLKNESIPAKLKVILSDNLAKLTIITPSGDKSILERFEFFKKSTETLNNVKKGISKEILTKIPIDNPAICVEKFLQMV